MIHITGEYYYDIEAREYVLLRRYSKEKGVFGKTGATTGEFVDKIEEVGYFQTLECLLRRLARILIKQKYDNGEINSLREHIDALCEMREELREILCEEE